MNKQDERSPEQIQELTKNLKGVPLESRKRWVLKQAAFVMACAIALVLVLTYASGVWLAVGLTIVALFAGMLPELFIDLRYGKYKREWELVNGSDEPTSSGPS